MTRIVFATVFLLLSTFSVAHCQLQAPVLYYKAPMSLDLDAPSIPALPVHQLRVVDADAPLAAAEPVLPVRGVVWQGIPPGQACTGVCVTFSNQGAAALQAVTGKRIHGFQLVSATTCNLSAIDHRFGAGLIIQLANSMNIQTLSKQAGTAVVQQTIDTNWRKLILLAVNVGSTVAMGVTTSGLVAASRAWQSGLVLGHLALDSLPSLLKPGAPNPDPFLNNVLDDQGQISLPAGACTSALFSGVWSRDSVKVTGRVQLLQ